MTLDLSVTNPRLSSKTGGERATGNGGGSTPTTVLKRRDAVIPDSSFGIAASSGVVSYEKKEYQLTLSCFHRFHL
jgi:hypothetical protein